MFLICNGILAFLVKTLNFNSSHSLSFPDHDNSIKADTDEDNYANMASESPQKTAIIAEEEKEDRVEMQEKGNQELKGRQPAAGGLIISNEDLLDMIEEEEEEEEVEEGGGNGGLLGGASAAQEEEESVNINTEELNKKIEEFIRKMKEEIRIQAHQINNPNL
ncbi:hypothetical protein ACH5RR_017430 [Cinchona calisaya]|uniref:Uncharacterized protein n=1 Tax=Cinchona calisaya TaxID=153742 RepID=A0ABD2ZKA6_9GENT